MDESRIFSLISFPAKSPDLRRGSCAVVLIPAKSPAGENVAQKKNHGILNFKIWNFSS
jgi:hypothetical protein